MNFLAHLHLAEASPESRMGNLLGDFVKGYPWDERFPRPIWRGIMEHRYVDVFTDASEGWKSSRDLLPVGLRRYAGIVVDVFYDHILHREWAAFSEGETLDEFVASTHRDLESAMVHAPVDARAVIVEMMEQSWLTGYGSVEGVMSTLDRISHRSHRLSEIVEAGEKLCDTIPTMRKHFLTMYPKLIGHVAHVRRDLLSQQSVD